MIAFSLSVEPRRNQHGCGRRMLVLAAALVAGLFPAGCKSLALPKVRFASPVVTSNFSPANHVHAGAIPAGVRRVAVLPLHAEGWLPRETAVLEAAVRGELGQVERFEITVVTRADLAARFGRESFASAAALPADFLSRLRTDFGIDAVLLLDLTHYSPYQPLALGVRAKLVTGDAGAVLWSFDALFDAARPEVATAARRFSSGQKRTGPAAEDNSGVLQSPARFARYVGNAMFETIPPRRSE